MDIQVAVLCDAATDNGGKLNLLGTFDTIFAHQFPAVHPQCSIALRFLFNKVEEGQHKLRLNFVDEDGRPVMPPVEIPVEVSIPDETIYLSRNFIVNIQKLKFDKAGLYSIDLGLDGRQEGSIPLLVRRASISQPGPAKPQE